MSASHVAVEVNAAAAGSHITSSGREDPAPSSCGSAAANCKHGGARTCSLDDLIAAIVAVMVYPHFSVHCRVRAKRRPQTQTQLETERSARGGEAEDAVYPTGKMAAPVTRDREEFEEHVLHVIGRERPLTLGTVTHGGRAVGDAPQTNPKSENQLHALVFARGELLQTIDMNQDFSFEEALKMRWFVDEFQFSRVLDRPRYSLVGCPESIYTQRVGAVARFMALQDRSFVSIVQRVLAYTDARMHYGHPDVFDGYWCRFHVGVSKASPETNLSEDVFFGYDNAARGGRCAFVEYLHFGKGREVALNSTVIFENKLARGAAMSLRSADLYRLNRALPPLTRAAVMFGSVGHYLFTLLFDYTISSFLWVLLLMSIAQVGSEEIGILGSVYAIPWLFHLGYMFGLPLLVELLYERGLVGGLRKWSGNVLLGAVYYLFQLRTKAVGIQQALHGGSGRYAGTGRAIAVRGESVAALYRNFAHSHALHALELLLLLVLYVTSFRGDAPAHTALLKTYAVLAAALSWLLAPALFNPAVAYCADWHSVVTRKMDELREMYAWLARPFAEPRDSWSRWWWDARAKSLRLRVLRDRVSQARAIPSADDTNSTTAGAGPNAHVLAVPKAAEPEPEKARASSRSTDTNPSSSSSAAAAATSSSVRPASASSGTRTEPRETRPLSQPQPQQQPAAPRDSPPSPPPPPPPQRTAGRGRRSAGSLFSGASAFSQRALVVSVFELLLRVVLWAPWVVVAWSLLARALDLLPRLAVFAALLAALQRLAPARLRWLALVCCVLLLYTCETLESLLLHPLAPYSPRAHSLPLDRLGHVLGAILAGAIAAVAGADVLLCAHDAWLCGRDSAAVLEPSAATRRPWLIACVCDSVWFRPWQWVNRYLAPMFVATVNAIVTGAAAYLTNHHTKLLFGVPVDTLRAAHARRVLTSTTGERACANGKLVSTGGGGKNECA